MDSGIPGWVIVCGIVLGVVGWAIVRDALFGYVYQPKKPKRMDRPDGHTKLRR